MKTALTLLALTGLLATALPAVAQDNAATVEALFAAGKKLMADGKVAEACPKFLASYNLDHRVGTVLNLADCYELNGQLASAWARFVEASTMAQRAGQPERAAFASDHAKALAPQLSTLAISVVSPVPGLTVRRDDEPVDPGAYGVAVAVDGGKHVITASAPGMGPWSGDVTVRKSVDHQTLTIPALTPAPTEAVPPPETQSQGSPVRRYAGIGTVALGVVVVGVGTAFGVIALNKNHDSGADCGLDGNPNGCNQTGVNLRQTAVSDGTVSSVFIGLGAAAIVGGGVLWLTAGSAEHKTTVGFDGSSLRVSGTF